DVLLRELAPPEEDVQMVGGYQLIKLIGKGGMGSVYRARQVSLERIVALKVLNKHLTANPTYRERFLREAKAAGTFNHPNIVRAIDAGEEDGVLYFAMELVDGKSVAALLREEGPFPEARAVEISRQITRALSQAYRKNIIHRDIKPENILIDREGVAKLTDLGLAKFTGGEQRRITQAGMAMGTPYYISPEQIRLNADLDARVDIYALGATLFHMVCGRPPYVAESPTAVVSMHLSDSVPDPRVHNPSLSPMFCAVVMRMLAKAREDRYQTPDELLTALNALGDQPGVPVLFGAPSQETPGEENQGVGFGMIMAVVSFMALIALAYFLLFPPGKGDEEEDWLGPGGGSESPAPTPKVKKAEPPEKSPPPETVEPVEPAEKKADPPGASEHEKAYREVEVYMEEHPEDYRGILARFAAVEKKYKGTTSAILSGKAIERVRRRLDEAGADVLFDPDQGIVTRARRLKDLGRFAEGLKEYETFPENLRAGGWEEKLANARREYLVAGKREVEIKIRRAKDRVRRKKYQQALDLLQEAKALGVPGYAERLAQESETIRRLRADRLFQSFVSGFFHAATGGGLLDAEAYLSRWAKDPDAGPVRQDLKQAQETMEGIRVVMAARTRALNGLIGRPVDLRLKNGRRLRGTLKTATPQEGVVALKDMGGASTPFAPTEIGIRSLASICDLKGDPGWKAIAAFQLFLLGDIEAARQALACMEQGD
ncbi:MAG: protein kinase domain-containing protein, partial [Planctomycetota bacterium]